MSIPTNAVITGVYKKHERGPRLKNGQRWKGKKKWYVFWVDPALGRFGCSRITALKVPIYKTQVKKVRYV